MKNYLVLLLLLSLIILKSTHLLGSNVYENLWESTYKKYSSEKKIDGKLCLSNINNLQNLLLKIRR